MCLHLFSFTRCLEIAVHNFTIKTLYLLSYRLFNFLLTLPRYLFSNLSMNFARFGALTVYFKKTELYRTY